MPQLVSFDSLLNDCHVKEFPGNLVPSCHCELITYREGIAYGLRLRREAVARRDEGVSPICRSGFHLLGVGTSLVDIQVVRQHGSGLVARRPAARVRSTCASTKDPVVSDAV